MDGDPLIERLNRLAGGGGVRFVAATPAVVAGADLRATGNRSYGRNVYVATGDPPPLPPPAARRLGRTIAAGARERFAGCELRCEREGGELAVAVVADDGRPLTRTLRGPADATGACDEGLLAWYGPAEDICTPWSDNDPSQCQVVTVDGLREYARGRR